MNSAVLNGRGALMGMVKSTWLKEAWLKPLLEPVIWRELSNTALKPRLVKRLIEVRARTL